MSSYRQHPLSKAWPPIEGAEFDSLVADIKSRGLEEPITRWGDYILDGFQRYRACTKAGVAPRFTDFKGGDPVAFVLSKNKERRHISEGQKGLAEVEMRKWVPVGKPTKSTTNIPSPGRGLTTSEMAKEAGVSPSTIERAKVVSSKGTDETKRSALVGELTLKAAEAIAKMPKKEQSAAVKRATAPKPKAAKKAKPAPPPADTVPKEQYDALLKEYEALTANRDDLAYELEACELIRQDQMVIRYKQLQEQMKTCERSRNDAMNTAAQLQKQLNGYKREMKTRGWEPTGKA